MERFVLLRGAPRPHGWTGKLWAMQQGIEHHAQEHCREGIWLWFTDADIVHGPGTLRSLIAKGEGEGLAMVSLMVKLSSQGRATCLLIPAFIFFFQKLFPFAWVNDPKRPIAAAAGGCLLVRRQTFHNAGGLFAIRSRLIDDCAMAAAIKPHGLIWVGHAGSSHSLRLYPHLDDVWAMVVRTAYSQLGHSPRRLALCLAGMLLLYQIPWIVIVAAVGAGETTAAALGVAAMLLMLRCYAPTVSSYGLPVAWALTLPVAAFAYTLMTIDAARRHWLGRGGVWKGRVQDEEMAEASPRSPRIRRDLRRSLIFRCRRKCRCRKRSSRTRLPRRREGGRRFQ